MNVRLTTESPCAQADYGVFARLEANVAVPRIFVSSTFYDLRHIRNDLERFIKELGYEPVLHERGAVPYGSDQAVEEYCYREIAQCDILVAVIGGRYGSAARAEDGSVSQVELRTAVKLAKQVYIFVEQGVRSEMATFLRNKDKTDIQYAHVDDARIYRFLSEIGALQKNNATFEFASAADIQNILRVQFAGLFQRMLSQQARVEESRIAEQLVGAAKTLNDLVALMIQEQKFQAGAVGDVLLLHHPVFSKLRQEFRLDYRVSFLNLTELRALLRAFRFVEVDDGDDDEDRRWFYHWRRERSSPTHNHTDDLHIAQDLFDAGGQLKALKPGDWDETSVRYETTSTVKAPDDDIQF